ncbi:hypothetical protein QAD02_023537 [Eretmocerus hayati]|uniref:Uncharacterized protein n=1 Tax=Eretmocerus hayati TaxID=131215 RepID=A0ACC2PW70_9HYME|nr:hypothetical protein QAD02_023537 [Eretmocerus hayati]
MADTEFEEFRYYFDRLPQHLKAPISNYTLVHDVDVDDSPTSPSNNSSSNDEELEEDNRDNGILGGSNGVGSEERDSLIAQVDSEDEEVVILHRHHHHHHHHHHHQSHNEEYASGRSSSAADDCSEPECEQTCCSSIIADSDFSLFGGLGYRTLNNRGSIGAGGIGTTMGLLQQRCDSAVSDLADSYCSSLNSWPTPEHQASNCSGSGNGSRGKAHQPQRRRRLPEIPKNKKASLGGCNTSTLLGSMSSSSPSLAEELSLAAALGSGKPPQLIFRDKHQRASNNTRSSLSGSSSLQMYCSSGSNAAEDSSPDSERMMASCNDDSGHSTAHSPDFCTSLASNTVSCGGNGLMGKSGSTSIGQLLNECDSPSSTPGSSSGVPFTQLELLEATHRGLHKFVPRHRDEIDLEIGDPIYVQREADDLWCEGVNLRTGRQGIFPSAYAVDMEYSDFDPGAAKVKKERYLLGYLGSVETLAHKGTSVVCQAVKRIVGNTDENSSTVSPPPSQSCILEVSDQGLRMLDRSKPKKNSGPCHDYFYSLKNVSFCAFHPRDHRYLGFITKHPTLQRFACHVFIGQESTRPVAEAVGRAFHRFYTKFVETAFPIEDIYIE